MLNENSINWQYIFQSLEELSKERKKIVFFDWQKTIYSFKKGCPFDKEEKKLNNI